MNLGFMFGPMPPDDLMEDRSEHISEGAAIAAYQTGYREGSNEDEHRIFPDQPDIQPFYTAGHKKGLADRTIARTLSTDQPEEVRPAPKPTPRHVAMLHHAYHATLRWGYGNEESLRGLCYAAGTIYITLRIVRLLLGRD